MKSPRVLIKLGGSALEDNSILECLATAIHGYRKVGWQVILVHGGGKAINAELMARGIEWKFLDGQRVTTGEMMHVIESTLCGKVNQRIVRHLKADGLNAIGFSGSDRRTLLCHQASPQLGQVGKIYSVNAEWMEDVLALPTATLPVIAPIGVGDSGEFFNVNADWAASHLAVALKVDECIFLTDQPGIIDEEGEPIRETTATGLLEMIDCKIVTGGMLTKTLAVLNVLNSCASWGVSSVRIMKAQDCVHNVLTGTSGTTCRPDPILAEPSEKVAYAAI
jgi:acetylglutamate kinase